MPTWKLSYKCSTTGIKVYVLGKCKKIVYPDGIVKFEKQKKG